MLWSIISWLFLGFIVGGIARALVPGRQPMSVLGTIGLGIAGAFIGGLISWLFSGIPQEFSAEEAWPGWILSVVGSIILLILLYRRKSPR